LFDFFGKVVRIRAKFLRTTKNLPAPTPMVEADLTTIQSFNKQSLFAGNFLTTTKVASNTDNVAFHRSSAVFVSVALLRAFCDWKIKHQVSTVLSFSFFSCNHRCNQGAKGAMPPKCLAYLVILFFDRQRPEQNTVARLVKVFAPQINLGWLCYCL